MLYLFFKVYDLHGLIAVSRKNYAIMNSGSKLVDTEILEGELCESTNKVQTRIK